MWGVAVHYALCGVSEYLDVFSTPAEEKLVRRGSFLELNTYLSLSGGTGLGQLFTGKWMSFKCQSHSGGLLQPQPHVRAVN